MADITEAVVFELFSLCYLISLLNNSLIDNFVCITEKNIYIYIYMYFISTDSILSIVCEVGDILNESDEQRAVTLWASE